MKQRHAILGHGNLGNAIANEVLKHDHDFKFFTARGDWKYPKDSLQEIYDYAPSHVWVSLGTAVDTLDYKQAIDLNVKLPVELAQYLATFVHLHLFSVETKEPHCSFFHLSKIWMEQAIENINRPNTHIYRLEPLKGDYKKKKSNDNGIHVDEVAKGLFSSSQIFC
jgi:hypothetical protein